MLSIVIPVYAQAGALARTLKSLARQTVSPANFEIIVVDDASPVPIPDNVAEQFADLTVRVVRHAENRGRSAARNTGARAARGEYLLFQDSDSVAHPDLIRTHLDLLTADGERAVLGRRVESDWATAQTEFDSTSLSLQVSPDQDDVRHWFVVENEQVLQGSPWVFTCSHNFSLPRAVYEAVGGFDEHFRNWGYEDTEIGYRLYQHWGRDGRRFIFAPEATVYNVPHFADADKNWTHAADGLRYLKDKHQHFDVERLGVWPRGPVQTQPMYAEYLLRPGGASETALKELQDALPAADNRLWAGRLGDRLSSAPATTLDCTLPMSATNRPLIGMHTQFDDNSFGDVVHWDNWRVLNVGDLSALIVESLRLAPVLYLAGTRDLDSPRPVAQPSDLECVLENSLLDVRKMPGTPNVFITEVRRRA